MVLGDYRTGPLELFVLRALNRPYFLKINFLEFMNISLSHYTEVVTFLSTDIHFWIIYTSIIGMCSLNLIKQFK